VRIQTKALTCALSVCLVMAQPPDGGRGEVKVYFVENKAAKQWCGYRDLEEWKAAAQTLNPDVVGDLTYESGRLASILVFEDDESGDWGVTDTYSVDQNRNLTKIVRTINVLPDRTSETQLWTVRSGRAVKQSSSVVDLDTRKPGPKPVDWMKPDPVVTRIEGFPFAALIGKSKEIWSVGKACVAEPGSRR
jgi:hypothetical protein